MNIKDLNDKECIHCSTEQEAIAVMKLSGLLNWIKLHYHKSYPGRLTIYPTGKVYANVEYSNRKNHKIYPASLFIGNKIYELW